jgi:hypothetical protein
MSEEAYKKYKSGVTGVQEDFKSSLRTKVN